MIPQDDSWKKTWRPEGIKIKKWGGAQPGAGRKKGSKSKATLEKEVIRKRVEQKIMRIADELVESQVNVARGCQYLYVTRIDKDGKKGKPELIKDKETIEAYLAGELNDDKGEYYFITTERPDSSAADSLLDRGLGKQKPIELPSQILTQVNIYGDEQIAAIARRVIADGGQQSEGLFHGFQNSDQQKISE